LASALATLNFNVLTLHCFSGLKKVPRVPEQT
jgi:hypothetical protein